MTMRTIQRMLMCENFPPSTVVGRTTTPTPVEILRLPLEMLRKEV
jgi:hypothetical protein